MCEYIRVAEDEQVPEDAIELPSDEDGSILLSTIQAQFPGSTGLRFRNEETQTWRGVRLADGVLYPPVSGWGNALYIVVSNKPVDSSSKRKYEESPTGREPHTKIMKNYSMETDEELLSDMIILGLSWKAKDEDIRDYFSRFGELDYYEVKRNIQTGQSRGFAFIRFKEPAVAKTVLSRTHTILDRRVDIRLSKGKDESPRKIFIGRLPSNCTASDVRNYFEKYGTLSDVYLPQPYRQFGFVTFASCEAARNVLSHVHVINGARINCTPAEPKSQSKSRITGTHESPAPPREMRGFWSGNMVPYGSFPDRGGSSSIASQMNAMWNMAALAQGMAAGMAAQGMGGNMGGNMGSPMSMSGMSGMSGMLSTGGGIPSSHMVSSMNGGSGMGISHTGSSGMGISHTGSSAMGVSHTGPSAMGVSHTGSSAMGVSHTGSSAMDGTGSSERW